MCCLPIGLAAAAEPKTPLKPHPDAVANTHPPGEVDVPELVPFVVADPASLPGIVVDDTSAELVGRWQYSTHTPPYVGLGYLHDMKEGKGEKSVTFTPDLPDDGWYEVRLAHCYNIRRATNTPVTVHHADGETTLLINQQQVPEHDKLLRTLGTFRFTKGKAGWVRVANDGTDPIKVAIADAVQWLPRSGPALRPRLAVLTDIGGDPDDTQSLVRLLVYANEFEIEALVASASGTPGEVKEAITRTDLILQAIDAYEAVLPNLRRRAVGWPEAAALRAVTVAGNRFRKREHIGEAHDSDGSRRLIERIDAGTVERPLNICIWGGQTDLAQALWRVKHDRGDSGLADFVGRFRVYDIADQDGIAAWMHDEFPGLFYILSKSPGKRDKREASFRGMYLTGDESLTSRPWIDENIRNTGPLGELYPTKTWTAPNPHGCMKEGDTPSWFFFLPRGGNDPADPTKPGWGGRFERAADGWYRDVPVETGGDARLVVSSRRPEFQADFARRMAWCQAE